MIMRPDVPMERAKLIKKPVHVKGATNTWHGMAWTSSEGIPGRPSRQAENTVSRTSSQIQTQKLLTD